MPNQPCVGFGRMLRNWVLMAIELLQVAVLPEGIWRQHVPLCQNSTMKMRTNQSVQNPNALVLFNPALVLAPTDDMEWNKEMSGLEKRMGTKPENISPYHNMVGKLPPTIIFHGTGR
jgi:hypothetical protein